MFRKSLFIAALLTVASPLAAAELSGNDMITISLVGGLTVLIGGFFIALLAQVLSLMSNQQK